ncbi:acyclic terpene utilization AtuA family protein [Sphingorhabdus sp. EL138]|uniref:acyclic terpene utilization AtuA family protein n=1 Tax=Sphingorhabdus sp. EL138 TaxID=2073156 RepID=UPI000D687388|nr:acyclic terpene utilization AtuA family protein [Sphingorhabdus sp. EL138]
MSNDKIIRIGGASGFWGESDMAVPQLLKAAENGSGLDYIVFDYLAEITMSIMARARAKNPDLGYATDFVSAVIRPHIGAIAKQGIKLISNAGGTNPVACAAAVREVIAEAGLDIKVAVVTGDDLTARAADFAGAHEMFSGETFPDPENIASINAYLGAFPIAAALDQGAEIVITGRCVDSAVTLGACIHEFGWSRDDLDQLAGASLAGHILECGPQATGGNFTDWESIADSMDNAGYPIAEISGNGSFIATKPQGTGGIVNIGTIGEQMLYEIGDPQAYMLPDVVCDFSAVTLEQIGDNRVAVSGAIGHVAPDSYKTCATYSDGWKMVAPFFFIGMDAKRKAESFAENALKRTQAKLRASNAGDFDEVLIETLGDDSHFGAFGQAAETRELVLKIGVKHRDPKATMLLLKEATGMGLATPPGLALFAGGRPKPSPVVRLFSLLVPKSEVSISVTVGDDSQEFAEAKGAAFDTASIQRPDPPAHLGNAELMTEVPLIALAWGRSGDKGDKSNIGILPRDPKFAPYIWAALGEDKVHERFAHFLAKPEAPDNVERFYMPGTGAINFLLHDILGGGGVASMRNDPQGKSYAQILLAAPVSIPQSLQSSLAKAL